MRFSRAFSASLALLASLAAASPAGAQAFFAEHTEKLGSPQPCAATNEGCWTHYVVMADINGDDSLDLLFAAGGGYYEPGTTAPLIIYLNDGMGAFQLYNQAPIAGFQGRVRQIAVADIDGDGDLDIYAPDAFGKQPDAFFINDGQNPPHFVNEAVLRLSITSHAAGARFGDLDGDGDLDLVLTDWGNTDWSTQSGVFAASTAHVYLNDGSGHFAEKAGAFPAMAAKSGQGPIDVDMFDADGDFDLDLLVASRVGQPNVNAHLFLNDGTGTFTDAGSKLPDQLGPYQYGPEQCDVDGDGDLDIWIDNSGPASDNRTQLLINDGKGVFTDETIPRVSGGNLGNADDNRVTCVDLDGDGDLDVIIASLTTPERILINDGTGHFAPGADVFSSPPVIDATLGLDVGDVDGDGILDAVTAQGESGSFLNRLYLGVAPAEADVRAPKIRATEVLPESTPAGNLGVRFAVVDSAVTDVGPRLKQAYIDVDGTFVPARFMGGDIYRAFLTIGAGKTLNYRACAQDLAGNKDCGPMLTFTQGNGNPTTSSSTGGGAGGAGGSGVGGVGAEFAPDDTPGCQCEVPGPSRSSDGLGLLAGLAAAIAAVSRRRRARR